MYNWQGKKLLLLGATALIAEIAKYAQKHGAYVIVVDHLENSPAKLVANESHLISIRDIDKIVALIKDREIDGVLTGFTDSILPYYYEVCQRAGLACYITPKQIDFATNKKVFKDYCKKFDIPTIPEFHAGHNAISYPVIVKPVDNSGARGITICRSESGLDQAISVALEMSASGEYLIEKYLEYKEATVFYVFINGTAYCTLMGDRHVSHVKDGVIRLPTGYSFPSPHTRQFVTDFHAKLSGLFRYLGCENGMMFLQGFVDDQGAFIPYEPGFRLTGSLEYRLLQDVCGYNPLGMMIQHAFTGKMHDGTFNAPAPADIKPCYNISCLLKPGKIKTISGVKELQEAAGIIDIHASYKEGDVLPEDLWGKLAQIGFRFLIVPADERHYDDIVSLIKEKLRVVSEDGEDMLLNHGICGESLSCKP